MKGIERFVGGPLGMGNAFGLQKKEIAPAVVAGLIGLAGSALSTGVGGAMSASARRRARDIDAGMYARDYAQNLRDMYQSVAERKSGQALMTRVKNFNIANWRRAKGAQAVAGGTVAETQLAKDAGNKTMADTVANIGAMDDARYDRAKDAQRAADREYSSKMAGYEIENGKNAAAAASGLSNAATQLASAWAQSTDLTGGSNNSTTRSSGDSESGTTDQEDKMEKTLK